MKAFIYEWSDRKSGLKYIGRHIGEIDDGYTGSGSVFVNKYKSRPGDFTRIILWIDEYSTDEIIKAKEEEYLNPISEEELYYGQNRKYYNVVKNSHGYTSKNNPMKNPEIVKQMLETRIKKGSYINPHQAKVNKYGLDKTQELMSIAAQGNKNGSGNAGKSKTKEHKLKISETITEIYRQKLECGAEKLSNGDRKRSFPYDELIILVKEKGFKDAAKELNISVVALKSRYYNALKI